MAESTNRFCTSCGEPLREDAKFCVNCGAPRSAEPVAQEPPEPEPAFEPPAIPAPAQAAPAEHPAPAAVAAVPASGLPAAASGPLLDRRQRLVLAVGIVVVVAVAAAVIVIDKRGNRASNATTAPVAATTFATGAPTTIAEPATDPGSTAAPITKLGGLDASAVVRRLDADLASSASQVAALKNVIHAFDPQDGGGCQSSATDAAAQTGTIIKQRQAMMDRLGGLMSTNDATSRRLVTELRAAIQLSLQSDFDYQRWMAANTSTDATVPCARVRDGNGDWQSAQSIAPRAGDAKKTFVADYDPIAARLGLRSTWTYQDF